MRSDARRREQTTAPILLHAANQRLTAISTEPPCTQLTPSSAERARRVSAIGTTLAGLSADERHYWVGVFYTLLLPAERRREQATYFTPPYLAGAVLDLAVEYGFDLATGTVLDPAAGGAAFLSMIGARMWPQTFIRTTFADAFSVSKSTRALPGFPGCCLRTGSASKKSV